MARPREVEEARRKLALAATKAAVEKAGSAIVEVGGQRFAASLVLDNLPNVGLTHGGGAFVDVILRLDPVEDAP